MTWFDWIELLKGIELQNKDRVIVKAAIPLRGPNRIDGLKAGYALIEGSPLIYWSDGSTEIPA